MSRKKDSKGKRATRREPQRKSAVGATNLKNLVALQRWFLPNDSIFSKLKFHGNTSWAPSNLVWLAVCWAWSESRNLTDAFTEAVKCSQSFSASSTLNTYQGFMGAMVTWTTALMNVLFVQLQTRMKEIGGRFWEIDGWVPIGFDGSRSTAPRTEKNEKAFCAPNYGKGKTARFRKKKSKGMRRKKNQKSKPQPQAPQAWITMMWHMGLRLPFRWLLGPSNSSERSHVMDMLNAGAFAINTLFCGDAGFVGYPIWSAILGTGAHFLVRVGANVNLLSEHADIKRLGGGIVLCWPKDAIAAGLPPLRLRLVRVQIGKTKMWMLTSVLDRKKLNHKQIVRFYKMRWGIELEFRGLKQTLDRVKLRCRNDERLLVELNWSIMAMAIAELFALKEQLSESRSKSRNPQPYAPAKRSLANTMRALRGCLRNLHTIPPPEQDLLVLLRLAVTDSYQRKAKKAARYRPPNPDKKPLGDPKIRNITPQEKMKLRDHAKNQSA